MKATIVGLVYGWGFFNINQTLKECNQNLQEDVAIEKEKNKAESHKSPVGGKFRQEIDRQ